MLLGLVEQVSCLVVEDVVLELLEDARVHSLKNHALEGLVGGLEKRAKDLDALDADLVIYLIAAAVRTKSSLDVILYFYLLYQVLDSLWICIDHFKYNLNCIKKQRPAAALKRDLLSQKLGHNLKEVCGKVFLSKKLIRMLIEVSKGKEDGH